MNWEKRLNIFHPSLNGSLPPYVNCLLLLRIIIKTMYTHLNFRIFSYNVNQVIRPMKIILKIVLFLHIERNQHIVMKMVYHRSFESPILCLLRLSRIQSMQSKEKKNINILRWNKPDQTQVPSTQSQHMEERLIIYPATSVGRINSHSPISLTSVGEHAFMSIQPLKSLDTMGSFTKPIKFSNHPQLQSSSKV